MFNQDMPRNCCIHHTRAVCREIALPWLVQRDTLQMLTAIAIFLVLFLPQAVWAFPSHYGPAVKLDTVKDNTGSSNNQSNSAICQSISGETTDQNYLFDFAVNNKGVVTARDFVENDGQVALTPAPKTVKVVQYSQPSATENEKPQTASVLIQNQN
jgi:hypothetical protein